MANVALSKPAVDLFEAEGVWWITFNRPEASNAFTLADLDRLAEIFEEAGDRPLAAVLTGAGTSAFSAQSNTITPPGIGVPSAPTGATAVAGDTQAFVTWTVSSSNGGSPIVLTPPLSNCDTAGNCVVSVTPTLASGTYVVEARATFQTP